MNKGKVLLILLVLEFSILNSFYLVNASNHTNIIANYKILDTSKSKINLYKNDLENHRDNFEILEVINSSSVKTYMDVFKITNKASKQYDFIFNQEIMFIHNDGMLRTKDGYIGVALGSYFGDIGNKFIFELDSGIELHLIKIEEKADEHTIDGFYQKYDNSVIEFVVDSSKMEKESNGYIYNGNFNNAIQFKGKIESIMKIN